MTYAGRALASRAQSISELRTRLRRKAANLEDVEDVLAYLKESGYVDDQRFAGTFADMRRENQGLGKARVMRDLMIRRVSPQVAKTAVEASYNETDEIALIEKFLARKYRGKDLKALLADPKNHNSAYRKLRVAGFGGSNSIKILKRYVTSVEDVAEEIEETPEES